MPFLDYTGEPGRRKFEEEFKREIQANINKYVSNSNDYSSFGIAANTPGLDLGGAMFIQNQKDISSFDDIDDEGFDFY